MFQSEDDHVQVLQKKSLEHKVKIVNNFARSC